MPDASKRRRDASAEARAKRWLEENREALESSNRFVEENGLPLKNLRLLYYGARPTPAKCGAAEIIDAMDFQLAGDLTGGDQTDGCV